MSFEHRHVAEPGSKQGKGPISARQIWIEISLIVIAVSLATEALLYANNTLAHHPEWVSKKLQLTYISMNAEQAQRSRNLVAGNHLNLGSWNGFNEIWLGRKMPSGEAHFDWRLAPGAYIDCYIGSTHKGAAAFRMSRNSLARGAFVLVAPTGRFEQVVEQPDLDLEAHDDGWHSASLRARDGLVELWIDGTLLAQAPLIDPLQRLVGFRSGLSGAFVDNVKYTDDAGQVIIDESFANRRGLGSAFVLSLLTLLLICAPALIVYRRTGSLTSLTTTLVVSIQMLIAYRWFDEQWSTRYPYEAVEPGSRQILDRVRFEDLRKTLFVDTAEPASLAFQYERAVAFLRSSTLGPLEPSPYERESVAEIMLPSEWQIGVTPENISSTLRSLPLERPFIIVTAGGSQMWGTGALRRADRLPQQLLREVGSRLPNDRESIVINLAREGGRSTEQIPIYLQNVAPLKPDVVIVSMAVNEGGQFEAFRGQLEMLAEMSRRSCTPTFLVIEANTPEEGFQLSGHDIVRDVASRQSLAAIELDAFMEQPSVYNSGHIWWDGIHLTSYGQAIAARHLAEEIVRLTKREREGSGPCRAAP